MTDTQIIEWLQEVKQGMQNFLCSMKGEHVAGYYKYSFSGDRADEATFWGLANTVFAAKILYMTDNLSPAACDEMAGFIQGFQKKNGIISDSYIHKMAYGRRWRKAFKTGDFSNVFGWGTKRAETRQSFAALRCLGKKPLHPYVKIPLTPGAVRKYIRRLDWKNPWGASSHVSHLLFFLSNNAFFFPSAGSHGSELIEFVVNEANKYRQHDGSWYLRVHDCPTFQKVNSAMKILTGFDAAGVRDFSRAESLIDLCLSTDNTGDACNNLNIVFVLWYCSERTEYRKEEIKQFCRERLSIYRKHYWPEFGGFSFYERNANSVFYDACISLGKSEPDIHGTVLLCWGISLMSRILGIDQSLGLRIPFT